MPVDLSNPQGFNQFWEDTVYQFRKEGIGDYEPDDPANWTIPSNLQDSDGDPILEDHVTGPVTEQQLRAQNAFPFAWSVPQSHQPAYATVSTDQGEIQMQVVIFAEDTDPQAAFDKARALLGRIVNNVEGSALVDDSGTAHAAQVRLDNFQMDVGISPGDSRAQVRSGQAIFAIEIERNY